MTDIWLLSYLVLWAIVVLEGAIIVALLRGFTGLHQRLEQQSPHGLVRLATGAVLADEEFVGLSGHRIELSRLWDRGNLLLLFASVDCVPCRSLLARVGDAVRTDQLADWDVCVVCAGHQAQVRTLIEEINFPSEIPVAVIEYAALRWRYQISRTPTLAIVEEHGRVVDVVAGEIEAYLNVLSRRSKFRIPA